MSALTQTPTIHAVYSQPVTAPPAPASPASPATPPSCPSPAPPSSPAGRPTTCPPSQCHALRPLPSHFSFPARGGYGDSTLLRCEWAEHGYRMNVPHLTDLSVRLDTSGADGRLLERMAAAGYALTEDDAGASSEGAARGTLLQLTCHRVVLSTASRVLRSIIHDGSACGAPSTYAATSLTFRNCSLVPLLWFLHYLYSATVVASIALPDLVPTMELARHFQVLPLLAACEQRAAKLVSTQTLHALWSAATRSYEGLVVNVCTDFIVANMRDILFSDEFAGLPAFLRQCIGGLLHDSQHVVSSDHERRELIRLFHARQERPQPVEAEEAELRAVIDSAETRGPAMCNVEDATLTQLIRKQKAQPLFDALTALCSLYLSPTKEEGSRTAKETDRKAERVEDIAASFGRPAPVKLYADDEDDTDSDSDWDSDEEEGSHTTAEASPGWSKQPNSLPTPPSLFGRGPTTPRHRLHEKMESAAMFGSGSSKLSDGLPDLTIETADRPPRHPVVRHTRDRSCPLRQDQYVPVVAQQHVQQPPPMRARRPSAPAIL